MPHAGLMEIFSLLIGTLISVRRLEGLISGFCVRSWTEFGLRMAYYLGLCPKVAWVQTQDVIFQGFVSEAGSG
ncbi:hypothetical protein PBF_08253 [Cytobacillus firmus DS1]|uniref:Uncharacterized protein n=1 Tax=Cytobacillus firmus DS1 TaxID=1307436 RepID=W7LHG2_CYTFI|nr:hypothetical protein PBF_08253 [Cytobacillus firmus DS1]